MMDLMYRLWDCARRGFGGLQFQVTTETVDIVGVNADAIREIGFTWEVETDGDVSNIRIGGWENHKQLMLVTYEDMLEFDEEQQEHFKQSPLEFLAGISELAGQPQYRMLVYASDIMKAVVEGDDTQIVLHIASEDEELLDVVCETIMKKGIAMLNKTMHGDKAVIDVFPTKRKGTSCYRQN